MVKLMGARTSDQACIDGLVFFRVLTDGVEEGLENKDVLFDKMMRAGEFSKNFEFHAHNPSDFMLDYSEKNMSVFLNGHEDLDPAGILDVSVWLDVSLNAEKDGVRIVLEDDQQHIYSDISLTFFDIIKALRPLPSSQDKLMEMMGVHDHPLLQLIEAQSGDYYGMDKPVRGVLNNWLYAVISGPMFEHVHKMGPRRDAPGPNEPFYR